MREWWKQLNIWKKIAIIALVVVFLFWHPATRAVVVSWRNGYVSTILNPEYVQVIS